MIKLPTTRHTVLGVCGYLACSGLAFSQASVPSTASDSKTVELEKFIVEESMVESSGTLLPTSRPVDSVYGIAKAIEDTPRAITVLTPEALKQFSIKNVYDFAAAVPGASVVNYYGMPGIPTTRGLFTSIYFNGMLRVWNRNGYPTSFGSLESMDYVRGPAPATYSASSPGGYVNFVPKSPFFDDLRGVLSLTLGENNEYNTQVDVGGPLLLLGKPAAFRLSITNQEADSHYKGIYNNYTSIYGSLKMKLNEKTSVFTGGEFYRHRSKENPGWNRVTQDLIDNQRYITGSPTNDLTGAVTAVPGVGPVVNDTPGFVNRPALENATPFGGSRGDFNNSYLAQSGFASSGFNPATFAANPIYNFLGNLNNPGGATTVKLDTDQVLTDSSDFADADTYLWFADVVVEPNPDFSIINKSLIDAYEREKVSSYGYGEYGKNFTFENKTIFLKQLDVLKGVDLAFGPAIRYEDALAKTEFTVEPFNRRDISKAPTQNDRLYSGGQRGLVGPFAGRTYWDPFGSNESQMTTVGLFLTPEVRFTKRLSVIGSARIDHAAWDRAVPFDLAADFNSGDKGSGSKRYTNFGVSPVYKVNDHLTLYATGQKGTSFQGFYVSGGVDSGDQNFQESSLGELGIKTVLFDRKLFAGVNYFYQELVNFDSRSGVAMPQRGSGVEFEVTYEPNKNFSISANTTWQQHFFRSSTLPGGYVPLTPAQIAQFGGIFTSDFGGRANPGGPRYGIPEWQAGLLARYRFDNGFGVSGGPSFTDSVYANPDKTITLPEYVLWNLNVFYVQPKWEIFVSVRNLTDELYFSPYDSFAANSIIMPSLPRQVSATFKYRF